MLRIFEVKTICLAKGRGRPPVHSTYKVAAADVEKAIEKVKKLSDWSNLERVLSVALLASTD